MISRIGTTPLAASLSAALAFAAVAPARADTVADFYKGKTITYVVAVGPGGMYGLYGQTLIKHWASHIPGHPSMVISYRPGAGGYTAANYLANAAPRDGTYVAMLLKDLPVGQLLQPKGVRFDMGKMQWIGNVATVPNVIGVMANAPATSIEGAKKVQLLLGATGVQDAESSLNPQLMNAMIGTKFKIVPGYRGVADINVAMERGEVQGRANSLVSFTTLKPEWIAQGKVKFLVQIGLERSPKLPDVPLWTELAPNAESRDILRFMSVTTQLGRGVFTLPGVPKARVEALRRAFDATMKDPAFLAEAKAHHLDVDPTPGEKVQALVGELTSAPKTRVARIRKILGFN